MARLLATLALAGAVTAPARGADAIYSYVDGGGVVHYTNVAPDSRYQLVDGKVARVEAVARDPRSRRAGSRGGGTGRRDGMTASGGNSLAQPRRWSSAFDEHIRAAAQKYGLAPLLLKAVMAAESNFDPGAVSEKGATGLMQLMPATARDMYVFDLLDPAQNIDGGARYLRQLQDRFGGDLERVLAAYNAGPERVDRSGGAVPAIAETQAYVRKVLGLYQAYSKGR
jgi:soluble lytic murein transglycosylase-like protein